MKLYLKNIGKIAEAAVEIKGITVIAGENDTGKSTVGKALFSIFNSFYDVQKQIRQERMLSVSSVLNKVSRRVAFGYSLGRDWEENVGDIVDQADQYIDNPDLLKEKILGILDLLPNKVKMDLQDTDIEDMVIRIIERLKVSDTDIFQTVTNDKVNSEFNGQILNVYTEGEGEITLETRDNCFTIKILEESVLIDQIGYSLHTEAIYIDDPLVLDAMDHKMFMNRLRSSTHRAQLENKLLDDYNTSVVEKILVENKLKDIYEKIMSVCDGDLVRIRSNGDMGYRLKNSDKTISIKNLSTGLKTFAILKTLLTNGAIGNNGTVILDEPEIHLHPEWQLLFAEIIVLLHKEFDMHILLNTHSPYFLRAIEVYAAKYEVSDMCKYYLSEAGENGEAYINDVTNEVNQIYEKLSTPLQRLEDERWDY